MILYLLWCHHSVIEFLCRRIGRLWRPEERTFPADYTDTDYTDATNKTKKYFISAETQKDPRLYFVTITLVIWIINDVFLWCKYGQGWDLTASQTRQPGWPLHQSGSAPGNIDVQNKSNEHNNLELFRLSKICKTTCLLKLIYFSVRINMIYIVYCRPYSVVFMEGPLKPIETAAICSKL